MSSAEIPRERRKKVRVLVVEDEPVQFQITVATLEREGGGIFVWEHAETLAETLEKIKAGNIDVVLLDMSLPDSEGIDTVTSVVALAKWRTPVVVFTGTDDEDFALEVLRAGAQDYLIKGLDRGRTICRSLRYSIEHYHTERGLMFSESRFRDIAELSSDWFWETGVDLKFSYVSEGIRQFLGIDPESMAGTSWSDVLSANNDDGSVEEILRALGDREPFRNFIYRCAGALGDHYVRISGKPVFSPSGRFVGYRGSGADVTVDMEVARLRDERQLAVDFAHDQEMARLQMEKVNQAKMLQLANVSHEIRTPLQGILGLSAIGQKRADKRAVEDTVELFEEIHQCGQRLSSFVKDLQDIVRLEAGNMQYEMRPESIIDIVRSSISDAMPVFERKNQIVELLENNQQECSVLADPIQLGRVFANVLSNAQKFSPDHTRVTVTISTADSLGDQASGPTVSISVADEGCGIPDEEMNSIFESFVQSSTTPTNHGTGLGLAICREIVTAHGGSITARNRPQGGTEFIVTLALITQDEGFII